MLSQKALQRVRVRPRTFYDKEMTPEQKKLLSPRPEDRAAFASFLRQDNTGLVRLLPKGKYEFSETIDASRDPNTILPIRGGGAFYSFTRKVHEFGPWSEITFQKGLLFSGFAPETLGLLVSLGDVPLESVTVATPGVEFLATFEPPVKYIEAQQQRNRNIRGIQVGKFRYNATLPAIPGTTYVLRSTSYKKEGYLASFAAVYIPHPAEYRGSDILIAFRVVRQEQDGSLILLWKRLQKYEARKLKDVPKALKTEEVKAMIDAEISAGSSVRQVLTFLESKGISHSDYLENPEMIGAQLTAGIKGLIYASIPNVERRGFSIFDMYIHFYFDREQKLAEYKLSKVRK